eukprot:scaffold2664_cov267-Pinguiococcus_pyrenoidosus.AAC.13
MLLGRVTDLPRAVFLVCPKLSLRTHFPKDSVRRRLKDWRRKRFSLMLWIRSYRSVPSFLSTSRRRRAPAALAAALFLVCFLAAATRSKSGR